MVVATGVAAGSAAALLMRLLYLVQHLAWHYRAGDFFDGAAAASPLLRLGLLSCAGLLAGVVLEATIRFHGSRLPPVQTTVKAVLSIVIVGLGA